MPADNFLIYSPYMSMKLLFQTWKEKIRTASPRADIEHVGASSIPGANTKGDLDISVQTNEKDFAPTVEKMKTIANIHHPELWAKDFAIFSTFDGETKVDIMVIVKDSDYDTFTKVRDALSADPQLVEEYNSIKAKHVPRTPEYYFAKRDFFNRILKQSFNIKS
jgi:GrpB-like predicted nucleotidyltransferase (UPF0157 family)